MGIVCFNTHLQQLRTFWYSLTNMHLPETCKLPSAELRGARCSKLCLTLLDEDQLNRIGLKCMYNFVYTVVYIHFYNMFRTW